MKSKYISNRSSERISLLSSTVSLASFYDLRQGTVRTDYNLIKKLMMTVGTDRTIKVSVN
jgi:hypothetical protein